MISHGFHVERIGLPCDCDGAVDEAHLLVMRLVSPVNNKKTTDQRNGQ